MRLKILLILCSTVFLSAQETRTPYVVSYLGIPILDMNMTRTEEDSLTTIIYDNQLRPFFQNLKHLHNVYRVTFRSGSYAPLHWSKNIQEGDLKFSLKARRIPGQARVRYTDGTTRPFPARAFTVFSATHYLEAIAAEAERFPLRLKIYIDGELWSALVNRFADPAESDLEDHPPGTVLLRARLHHLSGHSLVQQNDILTTQIAREGSQFLLWVNSDQKIIRARFGTFPKAVELDRRTPQP